MRHSTQVAADLLASSQTIFEARLADWCIKRAVRRVLLKHERVDASIQSLSPLSGTVAQAMSGCAFIFFLRGTDKLILFLNFAGSNPAGALWLLWAGQEEREGEKTTHRRGYMVNLPKVSVIASLAVPPAP